MCHEGVGWGGVYHVGVGHCKGGVGDVGMGWGVNNLICHKLGVLSVTG